MHKITLPYPSAKVQLFLVYQKKVVPLHHHFTGRHIRIALTIKRRGAGVVERGGLENR